MLNSEVRKTLNKYLFCGELLTNKNSVLDVMCGRGMGSFTISPYFEEVVGVDTSQENIDWAKEHLKNEDLIYMYRPINELSKLGTFEAAIVLDSDKKFENKESYIRCLNYIFEKNLINGGKLLFDYENNREELRVNFIAHYLEEYPEYHLFVATKDFSNRLKSIRI